MAINLGSTAISDIKLGETQVEKVYLGSEQVWGRTPAGPEWGTVVLYGVTQTYTQITDMQGGYVSVMNENYFQSLGLETGQTYTITVSSGCYDWPYMGTVNCKNMETGAITHPDAFEFSMAFDVNYECNPQTQMFEVSFVLTVGGIIIDYNTTSTITLQSQNEFNQLGTPTEQDHTVLNGTPSEAVKEVVIGSKVTSIPDRFLAFCTNLDSFDMSLATNVTSIGVNFLYACEKMNDPIFIPAGVTRVPNLFVAQCTTFNQPLTIPNTVTAIGDNFLASDYAFNQPVTVPNSVTSIGTGFLITCKALNSAVTLPTNLTTISNYFMQNCTSFNQPITIPSTVTSIGQMFLSACFLFNQPLSFPNGLATLGAYFLSNCRSFNQPLDFSNTQLTEVPVAFLFSANREPAFNSSIIFPTGITKIGAQFLKSNGLFNQDLSGVVRSSVTEIGAQFLSDCIALTSVPAIPAGCSVSKQSFMYNCNKITSIEVNGTLQSGTSGVNQTLATTDSSAPMYATGVTLTGSQRAAWISAFPNRTSSPYRKLIDGGA